MFTKQAMPTEHFNNFRDSTACVCHLLPFVKLAYLDTLSAKFNIFALWVIQFEMGGDDCVLTKLLYLLT